MVFNLVNRRKKDLQVLMCARISDRWKKHGSNIWLGIKKTWEKVYEGLEVVTDTNLVRWKWETNGMFSVKSAYESLIGGRSMGAHQWEKIWKVKAPQKCR